MKTEWTSQSGSSFAFYKDGEGIGVIFPGILQDGKIVKRDTGKFSAMHRGLNKPQTFGNRRQAEKFIEGSIKDVLETYNSKKKGKKI